MAVNTAWLVEGRNSRRTELAVPSACLLAPRPDRTLNGGQNIHLDHPIRTLSKSLRAYTKLFTPNFRILALKLPVG
jgi:hypothetical protein